MLIKLLSRSDPNIVLCAVGILSNLTCNNAKNKASVVCIYNYCISGRFGSGGEFGKLCMQTFRPPNFPTIFYRLSYYCDLAWTS